MGTHESSMISMNGSYTYTGHASGVHSASWSPDGKAIASAGGRLSTDDTVLVWQAT